MRFRILDEEGTVINTIIADIAFVDEHFPGRYQALPEDPAPEPILRYLLTRKEFKDRLTLEERIGLKTLAATDATALVFDEIIAEDEIDLTNATLIQCMAHFVTEEFLTQLRADELMTGI